LIKIELGIRCDNGTFLVDVEGKNGGQKQCFTNTR